MGAARDFFEGIKEAVVESTSLGNIVQDIGKELGRLGVQGQMEMASAIFNGSSFVPYGPGQYTPNAPEVAQGMDVAKDAPAIEPTPEPPKQEQSQGMEM